ncbi:predicted protein [Postia placenta Mad-698-R]|nr:predicted protein [Postia placenta Mad-698-R]
MRLFLRDRISAADLQEESLAIELSWTVQDTERLADILAEHGVDLLDVRFAEMVKKTHGHIIHGARFVAVSEGSPNNSLCRELRLISSRNTLTIAPSPHRSIPQIFGLAFNWGLQGTLCAQIYFYYTSFPKDTTTLKIFVGALFLAEWLQTSFTTINFLSDISWSDFESNELWELYRQVVPVVSGIIATAVQIFYAWRISVLSDCKTFRYGAALITLVWLSLTAFVDIVIAILMSILLYRSQSHSASTATLKTNLIQYTITSGAITASVALVAFALYMTDVLAFDPATDYWAPDYSGALSICPFWRALGYAGIASVHTGFQDFLSAARARSEQRVMVQRKQAANH